MEPRRCRAPGSDQPGHATHGRHDDQRDQILCPGRQRAEVDPTSRKATIDGVRLHRCNVTRAAHGSREQRLLPESLSARPLSSGRPGHTLGLASQLHTELNHADDQQRPTHTTDREQGPHSDERALIPGLADAILIRRWGPRFPFPSRSRGGEGGGRDLTGPGYETRLGPKNRRPLRFIPCRVREDRGGGGRHRGGESL